MDARAAGDPPEQDPELRRLVDWLPPVQRHLVSRTFFGGMFLAHAAREVGLPKRMARNQRDAGLAQLKLWLTEGDVPEGEPEVGQEFVFLDSVDCTVETVYGRCKQPAVDGELCAAHLEWLNAGITPDPQYERDVVEGRKTPVQAILSLAEMDSLISGRYRGDGRRLDIYTVFDPMERGDWT
jgi:hypothetical protein